MAGGDVDSELHWTTLALSFAQGALLTGLAREDDDNVLKTWQSRLSCHCYNVTSLGLEDQAAAICDWLWLILFIRSMDSPFDAFNISVCGLNGKDEAIWAKPCDLLSCN